VFVNLNPRASLRFTLGYIISPLWGFKKPRPVAVAKYKPYRPLRDSALVKVAFCAKSVFYLARNIRIIGPGSVLGL